MSDSPQMGRRASNRRRQKFGRDEEIDHIDVKLRQEFDKRKQALRVVDIGLVALTNSEIHTWLQMHETEMDRMRDLFCRKKPSPPNVVSYADATFLQIASFKSIHVRDMSREARIAGIKASRKLSSDTSAKKEGGAGQIRDNIDKLLTLAFASKHEEEHTNKQDKKTVTTPSTVNKENTDDISSDGASLSSTFSSSISSLTIPGIDENIDAKIIDLADNDSKVADSKQEEKKVITEETPKKSRWSLWGGATPVPEVTVEKEVVPVVTVASIEEESVRTESSAEPEDEWSSDEESEDVAKNRLKVRTIQDHFYLYSNDAEADASSRAKAAPTSNLPAPMPNEMQRELIGIHTVRPLKKKQSVIVNCLDVSLNRFRFLDFASASGSVNWSVTHIVALNLSGNLLVSLEGIEACAQLRVLNCSDNLLTSMTPLRGCKYLKRLKISGNRLRSLSLLSSSQLVDYYQIKAKYDNDIDVDDFDYDNELEHDKIAGLDDADNSISSGSYSESSNSDGQSAKVPPLDLHNTTQAEVSIELEDSKESKGEETSVEAKNTPSVKPKVHRMRNYPNVLGMPELEYMDASDNLLENLEGMRLYSRNTLVHLELRNCSIQSHHLNHLRFLPLARLHMDDNKIDNLKHTVAVLKSVTTVEHLSFLGNPISSNIDRGRDQCTNGIPANNYGSNLNLGLVMRVKSDVMKARESLFGKKGNDSLNQNLQSSPIEDIDPPLNPHIPQEQMPASQEEGGGLSLIEKLSKGMDIRAEVRETREGAYDTKSEIAGTTERKNYYAITVLDHVDNLKTFDHLPVPPAMYLELRRLKASVEGDVILRDIERHYAAEIESIQHVHADLASVHRQNENVVQQVVKEKAGRLEEEMDTLMKFAREKMSEIRPDKQSRRGVFQSRHKGQNNEILVDVDGHGTAPDEVDGDRLAAARFEAEKKLPEQNMQQIRDKYASLKATRNIEKEKEIEMHRLRDEEKKRAEEEARDGFRMRSAR